MSSITYNNNIVIADGDSLTLYDIEVSTSNTTGALKSFGGIGISNTTDATSSTNGGTFTSGGGGAFAKKLFVGSTLTAASLSLSTALPVTSGGIGTSSITQYQVVMANGTSAFSGISPSTSGYILTSNGISASPTFQAPVIVNLTSGVSGTLPVTSGGTGVTTKTGTGSVVLSTSPTLAGVVTINNGSTGNQLSIANTGQMEALVLGTSTATNQTIRCSNSSNHAYFGIDGTGASPNYSTGAAYVKSFTGAVYLAPNSLVALVATAAGVINIPNLTASRAVATDDSKNLVSVATIGSGSYVLATSPTLVTPVLGAASATSLSLGTALAVTSGGTGVTTKTGTGSVVLDTSPILVTPALGAASATSLSLGTALAVTSGGIGVTSITQYQVVMANGTTAFSGISPSTSGYILTSNGISLSPTFQAPAIINLTSGVSGTLPVTSGGTGVTTKTGTGSVVLDTSPILVTPVLGAASATSLSLSTALPVTSGGIGTSSITQYQVVMANGTSAFSGISPSTSGYILTSNGISASPTFQAPVIVNLTSGVSGTLPVTSGGTGVTTKTGTGSVVLDTSPSISGNMTFTSSTLGIILNNANAPLITRGWNPFTSGSYNGMGSWGLFMEPSVLTIGIPSFVSSGVQLATYNANSTIASVLLSASNTGVINIPNLTASYAVATDSSKNLVSVANTGSGNNVLATSPTLPGTLTLSSTVSNGIFMYPNTNGAENSIRFWVNTAGLPLWVVGTGVAGSGSDIFNIYSSTLGSNVLYAYNTGVINIPNLTASRAVATDDSKNLVSVATIGSGSYVLATSPTLTTPNIGVATGTSLTFTNTNDVVPLISTTSTNKYNLAQFSNASSTTYLGLGSTSYPSGGIDGASILVSQSTTPVILGTSGASRLVVDKNGDVSLSSSSLGIMLNGAGAPLITRQYNQFTSGSYYNTTNAAGRWGLFMENAALTLGIPIYADQNIGKIQLVTYNANSTIGLTLMSVSALGVVNIPNLTASSAVATDSSKNLVSVANTGSGKNVLAISPELTTPNIGVATGTSLTFTNTGDTGPILSNTSVSNVYNVFNISNTTDLTTVYLGMGSSGYPSGGSLGCALLTTAGPYSTILGTNGASRLVVDKNGDVSLSNSSLGVMLNGANAPLITRRYNQFTSGSYYNTTNAAGRWGLFLEPGALTLGALALTLGIPNSGDAPFTGIQFVTYNANSTIDKTLMSVSDLLGIQIRTRINTDSPIYVTGTQASSNVAYAYYAFNGSTGNSSNSVDISIRCDGRVTATEFNATSDIRIKKDINDICNIDTNILLLCKPKKYKYIDFLNNGTNYHYGFVAQELEQYAPELIAKDENYIPNIFKMANYISNSKFSIDFELNVGDKIKIFCSTTVTEKEVQKEILCSILECDNGIYTVDTDKLTKYIFIYGLLVDDMRTIDYIQLIPLLIKGYQQKHYKLEEMEMLIADNNQLIKRIERLEGIILKLDIDSF